MNKMSLAKNSGIDVNSLEADYADLNDEEDVVISREDRGPCIQFSEKAMTRLCEPWQNALLIKLLGRQHTYNFLHARLQQKWNLKGGWKLIDLVNDYFVVKFDLEEDLNFVLTGGPWLISGQYLVMQKWRPGFCPATAHITRMAAWIRVSAIQLECFDIWALKRIGNLLGKLLKVDALTTAQNRGKFARLCVELDLTKPLDAFVQINQVWYNIEYEGLPEICYSCGHYGHKKEACNLKTTSAGLTSETPLAAGTDTMGQPAEMEKENPVEGNEGLRGPWMNVPPRRKPKAIATEGKGMPSGGKGQGSRFEALREMDDIAEHIGGGVDRNASQIQPTLTATAKLNAKSGKKAWTKPKAALPGTRTALNDISNNAVQKQSVMSLGSKRGDIPSSSTSRAWNTAGKMVIGERPALNTVSINEQLTNWVSGQNVYNEKGLYIFGHQPPNIDSSGVEIETESDTYMDANTAIPEHPENTPLEQEMDLMEGQAQAINVEVPRD
ncbi:hypothetical protein ACE6H2_025906 [Prunus campanulata]